MIASGNKILSYFPTNNPKIKQKIPNQYRKYKKKTESKVIFKVNGSSTKGKNPVPLEIKI